MEFHIKGKGRVERLNQTLQSRLPVELRHAHITNIEDANVFLNSYIKKYNNQFALRLNSTKSVYEKQPSVEKINRTLAILSTRTIDSGHCIRFQSKFYFPVTENGDRRYFAGKTNCMVIETFDGQFLVNEYSANGRPLVTVEKSTQYAGQVHHTKKIEYGWKSTINLKEGIIILYHYYAFSIFIVLFLSIPHVMIFRVK